MRVDEVVADDGLLVSKGLDEMDGGHLLHVPIQTLLLIDPHSKSAKTKLYGLPSSQLLMLIPSINHYTV